jgi:hypothetical protein
MAIARNDGSAADTADRHCRVFTRRTLQNAVTIMPPVTQTLIFTLRFGCHCYIHGGTRWRSWLRHCATIRKVAGSIPDVVSGIFH